MAYTFAGSGAAGVNPSNMFAKNRTVLQQGRDKFNFLSDKIPKYLNM